MLRSRKSSSRLVVPKAESDADDDKNDDNNDHNDDDGDSKGKEEREDDDDNIFSPCFPHFVRTTGFTPHVCQNTSVRDTKVRPFSPALMTELNEIRSGSTPCADWMPVGCRNAMGCPKTMGLSMLSAKSHGSW